MRYKNFEKSVNHCAFLAQIWAMRFEHKVTAEKMSCIADKLIFKAAQIRNHSKESNDCFIKASNTYIEMAEMVITCFNLASEASKRKKKQFNFEG